MQRVPQVPQFELLVSSGVSQPFDMIPSQLPNPVLHEPRRQEPATHVGVALATRQTFAQLPQ
jgi:hypothetical protein